MKHCYYHPSVAATYHCKECQLLSCDHCSDEQDFAEAFCFHCDKELHSLGSAHSAEPFWRRIDASFKYALYTPLLIFIAVISLLSTVAQYLPFAFLWQVIITGAFVKYSFSCLQSSALGKFTPPDISESYQQGLQALMKLVIVMAGIFAMCFAAITFLGSLGIIISLLLLAALPAAIILLSLSDSVIEAINPLRLFQLIVNIGLPYGLILAFIMVLSSSVGLINSFFADYSFFNHALQSFVGNFYMIVMFHMMGYMIFQYQDRLGFVAKSDAESFHPRSEVEKCRSQLSMRLLNGDFETLVHDYVAAIKKYPKESSLADQCFEFLYASKNSEFIDEFGCFYLEYLLQQQKDYYLTAAYKRLLLVSPKFKADRADVRWALAQSFHAAGNFKMAIKILNGLHKEFPEFSKLAEAYYLLADCLLEIPGKDVEAKKFRQFSDKLQSQMLPAKAQPITQAKAEPSKQNPAQTTAAVVTPQASSAAHGKITPSAEFYGLSLVAKDD